MELGMIGLGRMGNGMTARLREGGHDIQTYDPKVEARTADSLAELKEQLEPPRPFWLMIPAGKITEDAFHELLGIADEGDTIIDGGNSNFHDSKRRYQEAKDKGIHFVDVGVSGGIWGRENGYALMVGGAEEHVARCMPIFEALKPEGELGFVHAGGVGAGHYAKMVHNGIEYGLMQAYGEGYELLLAAEVVTDVPGVIKSWRSGTVIRSWLLDLLDRALDEDPELAGIRGYAEDTGEGRWTVEEAIRLAVPLNVITDALFARFASRQEDSPAIKAVAALRNQFGGHAIRK
jgi:6-phosphogluconate dehydrogenase